MPCPDIEELTAYAGGGLAEVRRESLEEHMDRCSTCRCSVSEAARAQVGSRPHLGAEFAGEVGESVARFVIRETLGAGAVGVVYLARDPALERDVALKLMHPVDDGVDAELARERMLREGRALARVSHDNVVTVHEVGRHEDMVYMAMERIAGGNLRDWLQAQTRSREEILNVFIDVGCGLAEIHRAGLIHRDIKPQNILMRADGRAQVGDLGLARVQESIGSHELGEALPSSLTMTLTNTGFSVGTPAYMAPELLRGEAATVASDIYALGVTLFEAVVGTRPFLQETLAERLAASDEVASLLDNAGLQEPVRGLLLRALAPRSSERFSDAEAFVRALGDATGTRRRRWPLVAAGSLAVVALAGAGLATGLGDEGAAAIESCALAGQPLVDTWNRERAAIAKAFARIETSYAPPLWTRVQRDTASYVRQLSERRVEVCQALEATPGREDSNSQESSGASGASTTPQVESPRAFRSPRDVLAAKAQCLSRLEQSLSTTLRVWAGGDEKLLKNAAHTLASLDAVDSCTSQLPMGTEIDPRVTEAIAMSKAGRTDEAGAKILKLVDELEAGSYSLLVARMQRASIWRTQKKISEARQEWRAVIAEAEKLGADGLRAESWIHLASMASDELGDLDEAEEALLLAEAVMQRLGSNAELTPMLSMARARLALRKGEGPKAIEGLAKALEFDAPALDEALKRQLLARAYGVSGKFREMQTELERAEALVTEAAGESHPDVIPVYNSMVESKLELGDAQGALDASKKAERLTVEAFGADDYRLASILNNQSIVLDEMKKPKDSLKLMERAFAISSKKRGEEHPDTGVDAINLGGAYGAVGRFEEARAHYILGRDILQRALGPDHYKLSYAEMGLMSVAAEQEKISEAIVHARRTLELRRNPDISPYLAADAVHMLVQLLAVQGEKNEAKRLCKTEFERLAAPQTASEQRFYAEFKGFCREL